MSAGTVQARRMRQKRTAVTFRWRISPGEAAWLDASATRVRALIASHACPDHLKTSGPLYLLNLE